MANRIIISRAWCDHHLAECFHAYDEATGNNYHVGDPESFSPSGTAELITEKQRLEAQGYKCRHRAGTYTFTLWKASPLIPLPLDWQMHMDAHEPTQQDAERDDIIQDW